MSLSFPPPKACGALIVIHKVLRIRPELMSSNMMRVVVPVKRQKTTTKVDMSKFDDSDEEENYKDVSLEEVNGNVEKKEKKEADEPVPVSSWVHKKNVPASSSNLDESKIPTSYDPFKRAAAYSGAEHSLFYELTTMSRYFHPTVQVFIENILKNQKIKYVGDPMQDFSLSHFLDRFAFKNPKKVDPKSEKKSAFNNQYQSKGARGLSVHLLTDQNCTEDEKFILDFLHRKREVKKKFEDVEEDKTSDVESVDDDEFDDYLDSLGAKKDYDEFEKDYDYMSELQKDMKNDEIKSKKKKKGESDDEAEDDWDDIEDDESGEEMSEAEMDADEGDESATDESVDLEDLNNQSEGSMNSDIDDLSEDEIKPAKKKKPKGDGNIFVAVDEFSDMIEKNVASNHGTLGEIFNKDKSSQKQLDWETKRHGSSGSGFKRKSFGKKNLGGGQKSKKFKK